MAALAPSHLLPRLTAGPAAVRRSSRRIARAALFAIDALGGARSRACPDAAAMARRLRWIAENVCALHGVHVVARGPIPSAGPAVLVANHLGYLDPPAIVSLVPALAVAKRELGGWPVLGELMRSHGVMLVDRADRFSGAVALRRAMRALEEGASVLTFPEGTTSLGRDVLPFRRGMFGIARRLGVPVVPVAVRYDSPESCWVGDAAFVPHYVRTTARARTRVELTFAPAIDPRAPRSIEALAALARDVIRSTVITTPS